MREGNQQQIDFYIKLIKIRFQSKNAGSSEAGVFPIPVSYCTLQTKKKKKKKKVSSFGLNKLSDFYFCSIFRLEL